MLWYVPTDQLNLLRQFCNRLFQTSCSFFDEQPLCKFHKIYLCKHEYDLDLFMEKTHIRWIIKDEVQKQ